MKPPRTSLLGQLALLGVLFGIAACAGPRQSTCDQECRAEQRREHYLSAHPDLAPKIRAAIAQGRVVVGMSTRDVAAALGQPDGKVDAHAAWVEREQWVYRSEGGLPAYYVFRFGRLHSWTDQPVANN